MNEKDDLEALLKSDGWLRYEKALSEYWEGQLAPHLEVAASERDDTLAIHKLRQVLAAHRAIKQALAWPRERLKALTRPETTTSFTRGGYDPQATR